jgi:2-amino-4-hydroxy-6-hydroxymethyldihydropteridine diphosphokinase
LRPERARRAYLGLGSNVGDRLANLHGAVSRLRETAGVEVLRASSIYETEPVGEVTEQRDFYNAVLEVETTLTPQALLAACKEIERGLGRQPGGPRHAPRPIDLDLLLVEGATLAEEQLVLPHPGLAQRRFVLEPLVELQPDLALPDGTELATLLGGVGHGQRVERVGNIALWR